MQREEKKGRIYFLLSTALLSPTSAIGRCGVYYRPQRDGKLWTVECLGLLDR